MKLPNSEFLTPSELSNYLGVSKRTLLRQTECRQLPGFVRLFDSPRWRRDVICAWQDAGFSNEFAENYYANDGHTVTSSAPMKQELADV